MTFTLLSLLALNVSITVDYTPPLGSNLDTDEYRAASGPAIVTCNSGGASNVTYLWSSTCRNCTFDNISSPNITRAAVHSGDNGTHTCTVTMKSNGSVVVNTSASVNFKIVGKLYILYIYIYIYLCHLAWVVERSRI